ncbi:MAG: hypothetical protein OZ913_09250 [Ignavibacteriaceae bacterium]|nr:MAG: hypothetical protein EDM69_02760 [Chlorobiota bacterium]MBW7855116.1 hypothetical protein [Ignavibacteria bacterium]MCC6886381.1 hypothetical protein [Ignavibacteriales bacterium]MDL1886658.1 hypothetical protein [Ignavibacteria bacterium CHB1]MEB2330465.1 hypothetical protein [Ignavibacteriaceae bacterium]OQY76697.1 MAG: hypothetical protein B6D43_08705 [Ignavibacteriales bacterium UTCHB1]
MKSRVENILLVLIPIFFVGTALFAGEFRNPDETLNNCNSTCSEIIANCSSVGIESVGNPYTGNLKNDDCCCIQGTASGDEQSIFAIVRQIRDDGSISAVDYSHFSNRKLYHSILDGDVEQKIGVRNELFLLFSSLLI